jgi:predicted transcriptional regulator
MQDDLARLLLQLAGEDQPVVHLTAEEEASFKESLAQADRGEFATDEQVRRTLYRSVSSSSTKTAADQECSHP